MSTGVAWAVRCLYRPGGATDRLAIRLEHLEYIIAGLPHIVFGGALLADDGTALGMELIVGLETRHEVEQFIQAEPYTKAGLFAQVDITRVRQMTPPYDGKPLYDELAMERAKR